MNKLQRILDHEDTLPLAWAYIGVLILNLWGVWSMSTGRVPYDDITAFFSFLSGGIL